jgi:hypothetical protein
MLAHEIEDHAIFGNGKVGHFLRKARLEIWK